MSRATLDLELELTVSLRLIVALTIINRPREEREQSGSPKKAMRWLNQSLNRKFAAGTAAGLLASSLFFLALFVNLYQSQLEHERGSAAAQVGRLMRIALEDRLQIQDTHGIETLLGRLADGAGILGVAITDADGMVWASNDPAIVGARLVGPAEGLDAATTGLVEDPRGRIVLRSSMRLDDTRPCPECGGKTREPMRLHLDLDAGRIQQQARATTLLLMGSGALIVLLNISGGWWFIRRHVIDPLQRLSAVSRSLAEGDLDARLRLRGQDEFSRLAECFNQMAGRLQDDIRQLEDNERFLQSFVDAIPDGVRVIDESYRVLLANATYRHQLGFGPTDWLPQECYASAHRRDSPCPDILMLCPLKEVLRKDEPLRVVHRHQRLDGSNVDVEIYAAPMRVIQEGRERLLIVESIRDLQQEVRFSHEQRLSELGRLAAGVAHEIHNPLAALRMALHACMQISSAAQPDVEHLNEYLDLVDQEVVKCEQVTERLLKLSMPPPSQPELVELDRIVEDTLKLLCWEAEYHGIEVDVNVMGAPLRVLASDSDLRMITLNLTQNACHAMPDGGLLTVRCRREQGRILVELEDTGCGIDPNDLVHLFEPFFSRRADGIRGTGLGLSITKAITDSHGATISVQSTPGVGSCFTVSFPDADSGAREG